MLLLLQLWDGCCHGARAHGTASVPWQLSLCVYFCILLCGVGCMTWVLAGQPECEEPSWDSLFPG